jgi:hypothetical protein
MQEGEREADTPEAYIYIYREREDQNNRKDSTTNGEMELESILTTSKN